MKTNIRMGLMTTHMPCYVSSNDMKEGIDEHTMVVDDNTRGYRTCLRSDRDMDESTCKHTHEDRDNTHDYGTCIRSDRKIDEPAALLV